MNAVANTRNDLFTECPQIARCGGLQRTKRLVYVVAKVLCFHKAHDFIAVALLAIRAKEDDCRRSKDPEALQKFLVLFVVGRDIGLQHDGVGQGRLHTGVRERVLLHLDAGHAPVRVEIEHGCLARRRRGLDFTIQVRDRLDTLELEVFFLHGRQAAAEADRRERLERIGAAGQRAQEQQ